MTCRIQDNPFEEIFAVLGDQGLAGMREAAERMLNEVAKLDRAAYLGAQPYERGPERRGYGQRLQAEDGAKPLGRP